MGDLGRRRAILSRVRRLRWRAREDVKALLELPADRRRRRIECAQSRYRTRAVAELLLEESRRLVRTAPDEAANLARLVPVVLRWIQDADGSAWARSLELRAAAHEANAVRISGDLPAAERRFALLRRDLVMRPVDGVVALAEAASLEASLRIGQRRFGSADRLLERAALLYRHSRNAEGFARVQIQRANLAQSEGRAEVTIDLMQRALDGLDAERHPYLTLCTIVGRVNALCDLERFEEAAALLADFQPARRDTLDAHLHASLRLLDGRVMLGRGDYDSAEAAFVESREALAQTDRTYDAAVAALYLAEVYLAENRASDLRRLAEDLVVQFKARQVERESLAALHLLATAAAAEEVSLKQIVTARRLLQRHGG